ncbi:phenazine antibiotic biosynthesis protein [Xenorhabdus bovienii]|uniref:Phenazine antibiotic biosynthesis protein n=2 Tax=Xenorhabdus bovienii TaxID=40576 RepID=A0AAJ1JAX5_XENBV|nr:phenazine antibiotic biosynthesis protein [Xenorhabdus bovienii]MDE1480239.1 phenazine antibiotic biosynthesis protein [Xenorhabdus bovienii]MDE1492581.1 phenazine antibiotic biosynthesis protein [Xenorhabdus bovienii]MDE9511910.1 phenazine antibiotic biosynthesis protein [Xenorhabdus bovienii]MDE9523552.1 phenazine antibiotic biosynthesis protein [Xenorhabdus bovienii]
MNAPKMDGKMNDYSHEIKMLTAAQASQDPNRFVQEIMKWHFSEETGTDFWLVMRQELPFNPIRDVNTFNDLRKFPDISARLRTVPIQHLLPRGLKHDQQVSVYESGGTTETPKYVVAYDTWIQALVDWRMSSYKNRPGRPVGNTLAAVPSGPHIGGAINKVRAQKLGGLCFMIDIDPCWVKRSISEGDMACVRRYSSHLADQIENMLLNQDIRFLVTTLPVLRELVKRTELVAYMKRSLTQITLDGTEINLDEVKFIASEVLPECEFSAGYSSTSALGVSRSLLIEADSVRVEYDSFTPFITYDVVDRSTLETVEYGQRGAVVVSHLSHYAFYPRILERDTAIRLPGNGHIGDRLADIAIEATGIY